MASKFKLLVSKKKLRFRQDGFDLDLSYITGQIIAMGFPAEKLEGVYRNNIDDVARFFEQYHDGHYKIYNLCCERQYTTEKFNGLVVSYPFEDHNVPQFNQIIDLCENVDIYLKEDPKNVAAIHCKAGKGRTGLMICCYLLHSKLHISSQESLDFYSGKRTSDKKGVTIPSQQRYVHYYGHLIKKHLKYRAVCLQLKSIRFESVPNQNPPWTPYFTVKNNQQVRLSPQFSHNNKSSEMELALDEPIDIKGDVKVEFFNKRVVKEKMFHCWFNTFFVIHPLYDPSEADQLTIGSPDRNARPSCVKMRSPKIKVINNQNREAREMDGLVIPSALNHSASMHQPGNDQYDQLHRSGSALPRDKVLQKAKLGVVKTLKFTKWELDKALKDTGNRLYPKDFKVTFFFDLLESSDCGQNDVLPDSPLLPPPLLLRESQPVQATCSRFAQYEANADAGQVSSDASEDTDTDTDESDSDPQQPLTDISRKLLGPSAADNGDVLSSAAAASAAK